MTFASSKRGLPVRVVASALSLAIAGTAAAQPGASSYQGGEISRDDVPGNPQIDQLYVQGRLVGRELYDRTGRSIGMVAGVLRAPNGRVEGLQVELGGFLGLGERRRIAIPAAQLQAIDNRLVATDLTREAAESLPGN